MFDEHCRVDLICSIESRICRVAEGVRGAEEGYTSADRARMAAHAEALDRADSGNDEASSTRGELGAAAIQLTADDLREIDHAASRIEVHGARYPEHLQKMVGR